MSLTPGSCLGPYEVVSALGAGGMGEVYRARDTKLQRDVALKILPDLFAADPERLARFQREAQVLASLNHPNIAHIHGLEESGGQRALVMEFVDGEDLSRRIARGPIPTDEALPIARQIAEALEAAHEQGIVHRDLKPANIKVRADGTVKVLDFGLAKAMEGSGEAAAAGQAGARGWDRMSQSPTITTPAMTQAGIILGTAAYMSPEQARGKSVDRRADIWAFGCVLFEMLTGRRAFEGDDISITLAAVMMKEPDLNALPTSTSVGLRRLLVRCLKKDPNARLRDIGDARLEIDDVLTGRDGAASTMPTARSRGRTAAIAGGALLVGAVVAGTTMWILNRPVTAPLPVRFTVNPPRDWVFEGNAAQAFDMVISPDARLLAFVASTKGRRPQLWIRPVDSVTPQPLSDTDGARAPFWSPDSGFIGFFVNGKLKKVAVSGGASKVLCDGDPRGGTWNHDDTILFGQSGTLYRVNAAGGLPAPVTQLNAVREETSHRWPQFLPDGGHFLYFVQSAKPEYTGAYVGSLDGTEPRRIVATRANVAYAAGYLGFLRDRTLFAQPFDVTTLELNGEPVPIADGVSYSEPASSAAFSLTASGLAFVEDTVERRAPLTWVDRNGTEIKTLGVKGDYSLPKLSWDNNHAVAVRLDPRSGNRDLWMLDMVQPGESPLTSGLSVFAGNGVWSRDGQVALGVFRNGSYEIIVKKFPGTSDSRLLSFSGPGNFPTSWSPDGHWLVYQSLATETRLFLLSMSGEQKSRPFSQFGKQQFQGQVSPDGHWLAYMSNDSGSSEVYVQPFPDGGEPKRVSQSGGSDPRWRGDGKELFYISATNVLMSVPVAGALPPFSPSRELFPVQVPDRAYPYPIRYDVSANGQRFILDPGVIETRPSPMTVVLNWATALKP